MSAAGASSAWRRTTAADVDACRFEAVTISRQPATGAGHPNRTDGATPWAERGVDGVVQRRRLPLDAEAVTPVSWPPRAIRSRGGTAWSRLAVMVGGGSRRCFAETLLGHPAAHAPLGQNV